MAEGLLRHLGGDRFEALSAGTEATHVRPLAIAAMSERGIDISGQSSKTLERFREACLDTVVTVCDGARENCPVFSGARRTLHWSLPDPSLATGSDEERLSVYRRVRDELERRIRAEVLPGMR
jgi:arsenate reductase